MAEEDWPMIQWLAELDPAALPRSLSRKKRVLALDTYKFLTNGTYLQFRPQWREKLRQETTPKNGSETRAKARAADTELEQQRKAGAMRFLLELLANPGEPEAKKERFRRQWLAENPGVRPPWEAEAAEAAPPPSN
jgi:hypothetical protein